MGSIQIEFSKKSEHKRRNNFLENMKFWLNFCKNSKNVEVYEPLTIEKEMNTDKSSKNSVDRAFYPNRNSKQSIDIHSHVFEDEYQTDFDTTIGTVRSNGSPVPKMKKLRLTRVQTNEYDNETYAVYNIEMKK